MRQSLIESIILHESNFNDYVELDTDNPYFKCRVYDNYVEFVFPSDEPMVISGDVETGNAIEVANDLISQISNASSQDDAFVTLFDITQLPEYEEYDFRDSYLSDNPDPYGSELDPYYTSM